MIRRRGPASSAAAGLNQESLFETSEDMWTHKDEAARQIRDIEEGNRKIKAFPERITANSLHGSVQPFFTFAKGISS
jgi:hypothetical protein